MQRADRARCLPPAAFHELRCVFARRALSPDAEKADRSAPAVRQHRVRSRIHLTLSQPAGATDSTTVLAPRPIPHLAIPCLRRRFHRNDDELAGSEKGGELEGIRGVLAFTQWQRETCEQRRGALKGRLAFGIVSEHAYDVGALDSNDFAKTPPESPPIFVPADNGSVTRADKSNVEDATGLEMTFSAA